MAGAGAGPGSKREYRKYSDKIRLLREKAASDETEQVLCEARQVTAGLAPVPRLYPSISLPDVSRALSHQSGGGVMVRPRSPGPSSPYSRSTSTSPVRSASPRVVTLRHRDTFRLPGGSGNTLQIPNSRQRSKSDSNVCYTEPESCFTPEVMVVEVVGMLDTNINTATYTSPQEDLPPPPTRVRVIQRSPSPSRRNTVPGNILSFSDFEPDNAREQKKRSLPVGLGNQPCPEIIISDHDTRLAMETPRAAYFNPDTPESDQSSQSGDLFQEVLEELDTPLVRMMDPGSVNAFFENLNINSNQTENQSSNLTTLTSPHCFHYEAAPDLTNQGGFSLSPACQTDEFVVNNPVTTEQGVANTTDSDGLDPEILRFLQD